MLDYAKNAEISTILKIRKKSKKRHKTGKKR